MFLMFIGIKIFLYRHSEAITCIYVVARNVNIYRPFINHVIRRASTDRNKVPETLPGNLFFIFNINLHDLTIVFSKVHIELVVFNPFI